VQTRVNYDDLRDGRGTAAARRGRRHPHRPDATYPYPDGIVAKLPTKSYPESGDERPGNIPSRVCHGAHHSRNDRVT
jgi:hypothetical protein